MFQLFHADVAKVDRDVAIVVHICCKRFIPNVSSVFCICMLQVFQTHASSVSSIFFCMLQVLHMDVSKVDQDIATVFQLYVLNVLSVLDVCCKCFTWML